MDQDSCEELIINSGTCEADAILLFYKYTEDNVVHIGSTSGSHCKVCGDSKEEGLTVHYGHQGIEWIDKVKLINNLIVKTTLISQRTVDNYTEFDHCITLETYGINDISPLLGYGGVDKHASKNKIDINFNIINTSASAYLEDYSYSGGHYVDNWTSYFTQREKTVYHLQLTGSEKNYLLTDLSTTLTVRDNTIIGISAGYDGNPYQYLKSLGGNFEEIINSEPEFIYTEEDKLGIVYLKWEGNNGYLVLRTFWSQWTKEWKTCSVQDYCVFIK